MYGKYSKNITNQTKAGWFFYQPATFLQYKNTIYNVMISIIAYFFNKME